MSNITPKQLFFNVEDQKQIDTLYSLLSQENFDSVTGRLEQAGMRKGICILLSGTAGTGKTESVLQIARKTGRPLMQVQVSDIKDKYVGESEKKLAAMFDNYRNSMKEGQKTGILFLNECDQLLSKRLENISASVDQMSNAIQNILLEQMERFEGIMICTTNLVQNLDTAFERRFLYKIELGRPCPEARESIWKSMIPDITDFNATYLAQHYDLSGGQIENIARKSIIDIALNGQGSLTLEKYCDYCERERFNLPSASKCRIGF